MCQLLGDAVHQAPHRLTSDLQLAEAEILESAQYQGGLAALPAVPLPNRALVPIIDNANLHARRLFAQTPPAV